MATSISKAQAEGLAAGFFNESISAEGREGLTPKHSLSALAKLAGGLVIDAQKNLDKSNRVSSGALSSSIKVLDPRVVNGVNVVIDIELLDYYKFVDAGVKGKKSGSSAKGYAYKDKAPPVNVIRKWILKEGLKHRTDKYDVNKREKFRRKALNTIRSAETSVKAVAFLIARKIQYHGLKRTNFFVKAIKATEDRAADELSKGFKIDIINSLPSKL